MTRPAPAWPPCCARRAAATSEPAMDAIIIDAQNPWPGLAAYDEAASHWFKGRDDEADALLRLVQLAPLVALYGRSGLGKSSLLQAGHTNCYLDGGAQCARCARAMWFCAAQNRWRSAQTNST